MAQHPSLIKSFVSAYPGDRMFSHPLLLSSSPVTVALSLAGDLFTDFPCPLPGAELLVFQTSKSREHCRGGGKMIGDQDGEERSEICPLDMPEVWEP